MKKVFALLFTLCCWMCGSSQELTAAQQQAKDLLMNTYNNLRYQELHSRFNEQMKAGLPLDQLTQTIEGLQADLGKMKELGYLKQKDGVVFYKAVFEKETLEARISLDAEGFIDGLWFMPFIDPAVVIQRSKTSMQLPFKEQWFVFWGGDTETQNYHVISQAQRGAFDFIILDDKGQSYRKNRETNEDFYAFGKKIYAPCEGEVVTVINGLPDNKPGEMDPKNATGNTVVIKTPAEEYVVLAHFKQGSIKVKMGDKVAKGQLLGLCGNSGNSSEPHLHLHIQDAPLQSAATGLKCYFGELEVRTLAGKSRKKDYSPVKGDRISP